MGFLDWLFKQPRFKRFEDAFTLTRVKLWEALRNSIDSPHHSEKAVWLVVHFLDTFTELQNQLDRWGLDYDIVSSEIKVRELDRSGLLGKDSIKLILADLVPEPLSSIEVLNPKDNQQVAMIVVERHPMLDHDQRLLNFAKSLPVKVEFGYYLALDDVVIKSIIDPMTIQILKQLGLDDLELITSNMITRRLETVLRRHATAYQSDVRADSVVEWLEVNRAP